VLVRSTFLVNFRVIFVGSSGTVFSLAFRAANFFEGLSHIGFFSATACDPSTKTVYSGERVGALISELPCVRVGFIS
jgi:hypothetical protein